MGGRGGAQGGHEIAGGEGAHEAHEAEAGGAGDKLVEVAAAELGIEAVFVDVADVFDAADEFGGRIVGLKALQKLAGG